MGRLILCLFFLLCSCFSSISAQSDDITFIGESSPIFFLENAITTSVQTANDETLNVSVNDISVESERVLIRFYVTGLSANWKAKITDDNRLYGSYLPVAELVLDNGKILTPSSLSKFSFLEYNGELIIGGLLVFLTSDAPQAFYLNLNQIPFDTQPLSEGFTKAIILTSSGKDSDYVPVRNTWTVSGDGLEFTLSAAAQTNGLTMLQPAVRMERDDEILSKFGWITVSDPSDGKRFGVTRGNLYGFNLADDTVYSPAHAYIFSALGEPSPIQISMGHAYVVRSFDPVKSAVIDLSGEEKTVIDLDDDFTLTVTGVSPVPEEDRIRLYLDAGDKAAADISFTFEGIYDILKPSVMCGIEPDNRSFACDIFFDDISFPLTSMTVGIDAVEYYKEGPWTIFWTPVPMDAPSETPAAVSSDFPFTYAYPVEKKQPEEVQRVLDQIKDRNARLTAEPGWIHESYELNYVFSDGSEQSLIPADQFEMYFTHYISENWYSIDKNGHIHEKLSIVRDAANTHIHSAQRQLSGDVIDLIHALFVKTNQPLETVYSCFADFTEIAESSAIFLSEESCSENNRCFRFFQSLNGLPSGSGSQAITFELNPEDGFIYNETIDYDLGMLNLTRKTLVLEKTDDLPVEIRELIESVK